MNGHYHIKYMHQQVFETTFKQTVLDLVELVQQYDKMDEESDVEQFSKHDPLKNIISALPAKLRSDQGLARDESLQKADEIVRNAEQEVNKPGAKKRICAGIKDFTGDSLSLLPVLLLELTKTGAIVIPFDPTGVFLISAACLVVARVGISSFCAE
ncbi:MAG: hypothetical protein HC860_25020 [Alkalinema sp. RU_4_3]|nr:hypothetical protein [Alkalinema sp. RU_4_3]